jgi:hypothetical protein
MRVDKTGTKGKAETKGFPLAGPFDGLLIALTALAVYLKTMSHAMVPEDFGELATTATTLGIAHPTGYPLLTLMGKVVTTAPASGIEPFLRLNIFSSVLCAVALFFFHRLFGILLASQPSRSPAVSRVAEAAATLTLAFTPVFWAQSASFEVYALHLALTSIVLVLFLESLKAGAHPRVWMLFAFTLGLSFSNHMMTVLLAPACLYLYFSRLGFGAAAWRRIATAVPVFMLGLTPYLYLPIRSAADPLMNWGVPTRLSTFWRHVSASQYQHRMFVSADDARQKLVDFFAALPSDFAYLPLLVALIGLVYMLRRDRRSGIFAILLLLACLFFIGFYDFVDPNFELNAHFAVAIAVAFGVFALAEKLPSWQPRMLALLLVSFLLPLALNFRKADLSHDYITEDYSLNVLQSVEKNGIIFTRQGSLFTSPAFYLQFVRGVRPDVVIIDDMLGLPWYVAHLEKAHPGLFVGSEPELEGLLRETRKAERGEPFDRELAEARFNELVRHLALHGDRPVYITYDIAYSFGLRKIPSGILYRLVDRDAPPPPVGFRDFSFRPIPKSKLFTDLVTGYYAAAYVNQGIQAAVVYQDSVLGLRFVRKALAVDPSFAPARNWLTRLSPR